MFSLGWLLQIIFGLIVANYTNKSGTFLLSSPNYTYSWFVSFVTFIFYLKNVIFLKQFFKILLKICSWPWFDSPNTFIFLRLVNHLPLHKSRKSIGTCNSWRHELTAKLWNITEVLSITILLLMHHTGICKLTLLICCCTCSFDIYYNKQKTTFDKIISF